MPVHPILGDKLGGEGSPEVSPVLAVRRSYGDIRVTLMHTVQLTEFTIRTMTLKHANNTEQRTVNQYHYTVWPDHGVPECPSSLLTFVRKASRANPPDAGPMISYLIFRRKK